MESAGASVAIIIDNTEEDIQRIVMSDDGTGGGIGIPSLMISKKDGNKLIEFLKNMSPEDKQGYKTSVKIMVSFDLDKPDNRVEYDIWYTSSNDKALDFIEDFAQTDGTFGEQVLMTPHFVFWKCPLCEESFMRENCYAHGKYCAVEEKDESYKVSGRDIINEDLRQKCIYNKYYDKGSSRHVWWDYMQYIHINCRNSITEDCSKNAHEALEIPYEETWKCVEESFTEADWGSKTVTNHIIDEEIYYWKEYGSGLYPSIVVNNRTFRGQLDSLQVFNAICAGFKSAPRICFDTLGIFTPKSIKDFKNTQPGGVPGTVIFFIVVGVVLVNILFVYCCRRKQKREFRETMDMQIESTINQYKALSKSGSSSYIR